MKKMLLFMAGIVMSLLATSQTADSLLGKYVGNLPIANTLYSPTSPRTISDLKGKLVLLDFWSSRCLTCFHSFPQTSDLQRKFKDNVAVFYVSSQPRQELEDFFKRRPEFLKYGLSFITDDKELNRRFRHSTLPYFVWVGNDGRVKAITDRKDFNAVNIQKLLTKGTLDLPVIPSFVDFDYEAPFLSVDAFRTKMETSFVVTGMVDGLQAKMGFRTLEGGLQKMYVLNIPLWDLYGILFRDQVKFGSSGTRRWVQVLLKDPSRLVYPSDDSEARKAWARCVELTMKIDSSQKTNEQLIRKMRQELDHFLNVKSEVRRVRRECYVISPGPGFRPSTLPSAMTIGLNRTELKGQKPATVVAHIEGAFDSEVPIVAEGFGNQRIDLHVRAFKDFDELKNALADAGLLVTAEEREISQVFITD